MMDDRDKPFSCTSDGCDMTFTQEHYLNAHKTKHEMTLNLVLNEKNTFVADQTPTPTRFIRNCEEVGLFQDLQNVNPFDETFRKAIELAESGNLHVPEVSNDDTLHTPHILPHIIEENRTKLIEPSDEIMVNSFDVSNEPSTETDLLNVNEKVSNEHNNPSNTIVDLTNNAEKVDNNIKMESKKSNSKAVKEALKSKIISESDKNKMDSTSTDQAIIIAPIKLEKLQSVDSATIIIKTKPNPAISKTPRKRVLKQGSTLNTKKNKQTNNNEEEKNVSDIKEKQREMNRVAQSRSRERKKHWINEMEKKINDLTVENKRLSSENEYLKKEISVLNTIILYHRDCSVSKDENANAKLKTVIEETLKRLEPKKNISSYTKCMKPIRPYPTTPNVISYVSNLKPNNDTNIIPVVVQNKPIVFSPNIVAPIENSSQKFKNITLLQIDNASLPKLS